MKIVKISTPFPEWPLIRQTPQCKGEWGGYKFIINDNINKCDYWVVYEGLENKESVICNKVNTLFITGEPHSVKIYNKKFLSQFSKIISSQSEISHPGLVLSQQSLMWMVGAKYINGRWAQKFSKDYDELSRIKRSEKNKLISVVLSKKDQTVGHSKKNEFVQKLKVHFGSQLDVFGVGLNEIEDKWDAISDYKYHIVLENTSVENYWTEKLTDAYLGSAYPFYFGCPNLENYFSTKSFTRINIEDIRNSIHIIEESISNNLYESSLIDIAYAKSLVLDKYNLFPMLVRFIEENYVNENNNKLTLYNEAKFKKRSVKSKIKEYLK